jgi:hypothetical protein
MKKIENIIKQGQPIAVRITNGWYPEKNDKPAENVENVDLIKAFNGHYKKEGVQAHMETPFIELKDFKKFLKDSKHKLKGVGMASSHCRTLESYICIKNGEELTYLVHHPKDRFDSWMLMYLECHKPTEFNLDTEFMIMRIYANIEATIYFYFEEINE